MLHLTINVISFALETIIFKASCMSPSLQNLHFALIDKLLHCIFVAELLAINPVKFANTESKEAANFELVVCIEETFFWNVTFVVDPCTNDTVKAA